MASRYAYIPASTPTQVSTEPGILTGVFCPGGSPPVELYDTADGTTTDTEILKVSPDSEGPFEVALPDVIFTRGLYVSSDSAVTVFYQ